ncbi:CaiB/BaiF CoA transferase family protein [Extensimonas vulgaris]|uniref:Crotonobetainyl-CoA:carnitine CoA-transferase CaiB-like acyl-CoA transferase n=1 Tax=Extensimonas vulgaris TaxID=1031594 RepID=A0A369ADX0_9BURK|nr:CoA transferase [Extensimonas vulgaris]RCX07381.1 crotonobetainyl-CoA:carnitine CoA-transferase CaiB-like acyl-CoA transferase [Extensimonas vulgaris]TWI34859.1 crotonobetainyl-CoA:carnitine CoA-transferase CaiB-like acyl-CoA transferase [Extensimonas vulgaris]TXD12854.1 CoA transferase [Extensimonas vulgaris]
MSQPLRGVRILSFEQYGAGPFGTLHLADLGAEVIKIENPAEGGDVGRLVGPFYFGLGDSHFHEAFNRNKKSLTLNLKQDEARSVLADLVRSADAVFDNLRGDLPQKLGLTYEQLAPYNPRIVCAHLSAYGRTGSRTSWPGYDYLMQAEAGYLSLTGEPEGPPARFGLSIIDMMTGVTAVTGLLAGIIEARSTGRGRDIDTSLYDVAMGNLNYVAAWYLNEGHKVGRAPRSAHPSLTPSQLYRTQDGWIFIMCNKEKFWPALCQAIDRPDWAAHPDYANFAARLAHREQLTEALDAVLGTASTAEWLARFAGKVPAAPVYDVAQALDNPFAHEQGLILEAPHPARGSIRTVATPIRCPGEAPLVGIAPTLGEHTQALLTELGYDAQRIAQLEEKGAV